MPEKQSRQKPKDYKEDTTQFLIWLLKSDPTIKLGAVQDKLRRADNNELCLPEYWRVSFMYMYHSSLYHNPIMSTKF